MNKKALITSILISAVFSATSVAATESQTLPSETIGVITTEETNLRSMPLLSGIEVPKTLKVGEKGSFKVLYNYPSSNASQSWSFGDGTSDYSPNTTHIYTKPGIYNVKVNVKGYDSYPSGNYPFDVTYNYKVIVTKDELEPNNDFATAQELTRNSPIAGNISSTDITDMFYFDVIDERNVNFTLNKTTGDAKINWVVFNENDLNNYVAYPTAIDGNTLTGSFNLHPGKYYLKVYHIEGNNAQYNITIQ